MCKENQFFQLITQYSNFVQLLLKFIMELVLCKTFNPAHNDKIKIKLFSRNKIDFLHVDSNSEE